MPYQFSEAWTPGSKGEQFNLEILKGYHKHYEIKGKSLRSGCEFYVREGIQLKPRNDLNSPFCDEDKTGWKFYMKTIPIFHWVFIIGILKKSKDIFVEKLNDTLFSPEIEQSLRFLRNAKF